MPLAHLLIPILPHHLIPSTHWCIHSQTLIKGLLLSDPEPFIVYAHAHAGVKKPYDY